MSKFLVLLRGINVGGKNKISMIELKEHLTNEGFKNVISYINSGNIILESDKNAKEIKEIIEELLPRKFKLNSELIKVLVLSRKQLQAVIENKPKGFGEEPDKYYSDAIFLLGISEKKAMEVFNPKEGVDKVWEGKGVIYSQRLGAERTKSRLGKIIGTKPYKSMTIRSWNTTTKLLKMM